MTENDKLGLCSPGRRLNAGGARVSLSRRKRWRAGTACGPEHRGRLAGHHILDRSKAQRARLCGARDPFNLALVRRELDVTRVRPATPTVLQQALAFAQRRRGVGGILCLH